MTQWKDNRVRGKGAAATRGRRDQLTRKLCQNFKPCAPLNTTVPGTTSCRDPEPDFAGTNIM